MEDTFKILVPNSVQDYLQIILVIAKFVNVLHPVSYLTIQ